MDIELKKIADYVRVKMPPTPFAIFITEDRKGSGHAIFLSLPVEEDMHKIMGVDGLWKSESSYSREVINY